VTARSFTRRAVERPVSTLAALCGVVLLGAVSLGRLPVALLPDLTLPVLTIRTGYPGAAAPEVSRFVAEPIEAAIAATPGLVELRSVSRNGEVTTTMRFAWGTDMRTTTLGVRERLDVVRAQLPERAARPTLLTSDPGARPIAVLAMTRTASPNATRTSRELARLARDVVARRLAQVDGVASAAIIGAATDEIRIEVDADRLRALDLTPQDVANAIAEQNVTGVGGTIRRGQYRFSVRALTELRSLEELHGIPVGPPALGVTVRDVATVTPSTADPVTITRLDGSDAIGVVVYKDAGANTVSVTSRMMSTVQMLTQEFPDVQVSVVAAQAEFVVAALANLGQEIVVGGALSLLVILLFLRSWRVSLTIGVMVPLSVLVALTALQWMGVTINVLSLGGLALGTGLLVDTAIVVAESVGAKRDEGFSLMDAAIGGTEEVARPLFAGTLTTILVFGPIIFVRGLAAALFRDLSLSVVFTVAASLVLALTVMPVLMTRRVRVMPDASPLPAVPRTHVSRERWVDRVGARWANRYERGMAWALDHPAPVVGTALLTIAVAVLLVVHMPKDVLPQVDEGVVMADVQLPEGTAIESTVRVAQEVERAAATLGATGIYTRVGRAADEEVLAGARTGSSASAQLIIPVPPHRSATRFAAALRGALPQLVAQGALALDVAGQSEFGSVIGREGRTVRVEVSAADGRHAQQWADSLRYALQRSPDVAGVLTDIRDPSYGTQPVVEVTIDRTRLAMRGITPGAVVAGLQAALGGADATDFRETDARTPMRVRYAGVAHESLHAALATVVRGVPVAQLVTVHDTVAPVEVVRIAQRPVSVVEAVADGGGTSRAAAVVRGVLQTGRWPADVQFTVSGADEERTRTSNELIIAGVLAAAFVFLVLAGESASLTIPFVVMCTVPLAAVGGIAMLWLTDQSLNAVSLIGLVIMVGMADNEAVVKLDAIRRRRDAGMPVRDAVLQGGRARLRAITMTSITTVTGVLPLLFGVGGGGALYKPLAAAIIGGSVSTLLVTFFLLPTVYAVLETRASR